MSEARRRRRQSTPAPLVSPRGFRGMETPNNTVSPTEWVENTETRINALEVRVGTNETPDSIGTLEARITTLEEKLDEVCAAIHERASEHIQSDAAKDERIAALEARLVRCQGLIDAKDDHARG